MEIAIDGLEIYGYHGVLAEEKSLGQVFRFDLKLVMATCAGVSTDQVGDTVDYTEVIDIVSEIAGCRSYNLLERLAGAIVDALLDRFPVDSAWVRVTKPHPPIPCSVAGVGVSLERRRVGSVGDRPV